MGACEMLLEVYLGQFLRPLPSLLESPQHDGQSSEGQGSGVTKSPPTPLCRGHNLRGGKLLFECGTRQWCNDSGVKKGPADLAVGGHNLRGR